MIDETHPLPSFKRKRRSETVINLSSFFVEQPRNHRFLVLKCAAEGKTFKSVSAVRLAKTIDDIIDKLQSVVRQRDGSILVEAKSDE